MQSSFRILSALYQIVNVNTVTDHINGKVYIGEPPLTSQKEDISLNLLNNPNTYLQSGYCNVNVYVPLLTEGRPNLLRFDQILYRLIPLLEDASITVNGQSYFFQIDDDKGTFKDQDRDGMGYYNLKLNFQT